MKKVVNAIMFFVMAVTLAACGKSVDSAQDTKISISGPVLSEEIQGSSENNRKDSLAGEKVVTKNTEEQSEQEEDMKVSTLVVYFSCTGTTKALAEYAADILVADLYEIVPEKPYTDEDLSYYTGGRADKEQDDPQARPAISGSIPDIAGYDKILLGYPIWHGQAPRIISTFLESCDFSGKTVIPFCTSHSSGIGTSDTNLHGLCSDTTEWKAGMRFSSSTTKDEIQEWLDGFSLDELVSTNKI